MGYDHNHYNYQIAVIFAILIGGCILLGLTLMALYMLVTSMRGADDKKKLQPRSSPIPWSQPPSTMYRPAQPASPQSFAPPPPGQTNGAYGQQYPQPYDDGYRNMTPQALPQPLLAPQNYEPYRSTYDDARARSMPAQSGAFYQSSV